MDSCTQHCCLEMDIDYTDMVGGVVVGNTVVVGYMVRNRAVDDVVYSYGQNIVSVVGDIEVGNCVVDYLEVELVAVCVGYCVF